MSFFMIVGEKLTELRSIVKQMAVQVSVVCS